MDKDLETTVMELIVQAGDARSLALQAIRTARAGAWQKTEKLMAECENAMFKAHEIQTELIRTELEGEPVKMNLLMVHAQDHVMNAMTIKDLAAEIIAMIQNKDELD